MKLPLSVCLSVCLSGCLSISQLSVFLGFFDNRWLVFSIFLYNDR